MVLSWCFVLLFLHTDMLMCGNLAKNWIINILAVFFPFFLSRSSPLPPFFSNSHDKTTAVNVYLCCQHGWEHYGCLKCKEASTGSPGLLAEHNLYSGGQNKVSVQYKYCCLVLTLRCSGAFHDSFFFFPSRLFVVSSFFRTSSHY